ncbi:hypothetical protein [Kitasatospora sp. NPDC059673]|uniref:hypothetical protein n=1 Tax=Kitasatospora sp. NPDC059673 TaxID=3346901 RepID=UPI003686B98C
MGDERKYYGPLEVLDGRWAVGDSTLLSGRWVELRADGMVPHTGDIEGELIRWSSVMDGIGIHIGRFARGSRFEAGFGLDSLWPSKRPGIGYLYLTLRHPYEDRKLTFDRHPHYYPAQEVLLTVELMTSTVAAGNAQLLGDPEWLARAVDRLSRITHWPAFHQPAAVLKEALAGED